MVPTYVPCIFHVTISGTGSWSLQANRETLLELRSEFRSDALFVTAIGESGIRTHDLRHAKDAF